MNIKQLLLVALIQSLIAYIIFPFIPPILQEITGNPELSSQTTEVYRIIFTGGVITMLILGLVFIGKKTTYEWYFILFSEAFLAVIFYQNYGEYLALTLTFLAFAFLIFILRIPLRKFITNKNILSN
jgi:large-conductance mechanosensitive channel